MHKDDVWQIFDKNGEAVQGKGWDAGKDNPTRADDVLVAGAAVFLYRKSKENGLELLWQRRAEGIDNGGLWDYSAGGHVNLGESFAEAAVRETYEEIGAKIKPEELNFISARRTINGLLLRTLYLVDWTNKPADFHFDDGEVSEVRWVPLKEVKEFRKNFAKPSVRKDKATFSIIKDWFLSEGLIEEDE